MTISGLHRELPVIPQAPNARLHTVEPPPAAADPPFWRALRGLGREIDAGEVRVQSASQLRRYDTGTLIALQAGIYRYTEAVDLASKIVDRATNAVHTVLSSGR